MTQGSGSPPRHWRGRTVNHPRREPRRPHRALGSTGRAVPCPMGCGSRPHARARWLVTLPSSGAVVRPAIHEPRPRVAADNVVSASEITCASLNATFALLIRLPCVGSWERILDHNARPGTWAVGKIGACAVSLAGRSIGSSTALRAESMRSIRSIAASVSCPGRPRPRLRAPPL